MQYVITPPEQPSVGVHGTEKRFAVRRIFCVGRNYAAHAREMGHNPDREPPFFFTKPADALVESGSTIAYPPETQDLHFEIELVAAIGVSGKNISEETALEHIFGYGVGIDLTRRDLQGQAKKAGRPWDWGKAFDQSAPCSKLTPLNEKQHPFNNRIWLSVDDELKQDGNTDELIWSVAEVIAIISRSMEIRAGDLIYTGTPAGVGPVVSGQTLKGGVEGVDEIEISFK